MSDRIVSWQMSLNDKVTEKLREADEAGKKLNGTIGGLKQGLGLLGVSFGLLAGAEFLKGGMEKFERFHQAEGQMKNTMQNMGTYSEENFEKAVKGAKDLAAHVKYSTADIIDLKNHIGTMSGVSLDEMDKISAAAADLAAHTGKGILESGQSIAKAMNNPMMMRSLAKDLNIEKSVTDKIKELGEQGNIAGARMLVLKSVIDKTSGDAKTAFDNDPLAQYNKIVGSIQMAIGKWGTQLLVYLKPALEGIVTVVKDSVAWTKKHENLLKDVGKAILAVAGAVTIYRLAVIAGNAIDLIGIAIKTAQTMQMVAMTAYYEAGAGATGLLSAAQAALNIVMTANPIGVIIVVIGALIAGFVLAYQHVGWFRGGLLGLWEGFKSFGKNITEGPMKILYELGQAFANIFHPSKMIEHFKAALGVVTAAAHDIGSAAKKGYDQGIADVAKNDNSSTSTDPKTDIKHVNETTKGGGQLPGDGSGTDKKATAGMKGNKTISITIKIDSLIKDFRITTANMRDSAASVKEQIVNAMTSAMNDSQLVAER